ncbi:hypothetical protein [Microbulbifer epialgicus]|uniref:Intein N-terminal splicing region n=1 Tax=Microbulbifer epialgicus TaxID=393907 RepID=A0ABV4P1H2_9GAMM
MTTPSGQIGFSHLSVEIGAASTSQRSLNDSSVRILAGKSSGQIGLGDCRGKSWYAYTTAMTDWASRRSHTYFGGTANAYHRIYFNTDGTITTNGTLNSGSSRWVSQTGTPGNDFDIRVNVTSNGTGSEFSNGIAANTWYRLDAQRYFEHYVSRTTNGSTTGESKFKVELRWRGDNSIKDTATFTLNTTAIRSSDVDPDPGCLWTGYEIETKSGFKKLKDLVIGDVVKSYIIHGLPDESSQRRWEEWQASELSGDLSWSVVKHLEITEERMHMEVNAAKCSLSHPFFIERNGLYGFCRALYLKAGDKLLKDDLTWDSLIHIRLVKEPLEVLMLDVEETDTYIAGGYVNHNGVHKP